MTNRPARRSMASAFAPEPPSGDRSAQLKGVLPPRNSRPARPTTEPGEEVTETSPHRARDGARVDPPSDQPPSVKSEPSAPIVAADVVRGVVVYLPVDLMEKLRMTGRSRELTYAELLVEAAAAHLDDVAAVLAPARLADPSGAAMPGRATPPRKEPGVQVALRLNGHQVAWLDAAASRLGAASRTALVVALFRAHLTTAKST